MVHPHWRGEHFSLHWLEDWQCGSSPLAWGTHAHARPVAVIQRFIPTGVGNTSGVLMIIAELAVHPHWRGEHIKLSNITA